MKFKVPVFIVLGIITILLSCQKEDTPPPVLPTTRLNVVNATADVFNVFQNGNRLNNAASLFPGGATGYLDVTASEQNYEFKRNGSPDVLVSFKLTLDTLTTHSLFVTGFTADEIFLTDDSFTPDTGSRALVRFVNASPETTGVDLALTDTTADAGTVKFNDKAFKSISDFVPVPVSNGAKQLKMFRSGSATALVTDTINLQSGGVYTIFAKGRISQTGNAAFGAGIITNQ